MMKVILWDRGTVPVSIIWPHPTSVLMLQRNRAGFDRVGAGLALLTTKGIPESAVQRALHPVINVETEVERRTNPNRNRQIDGSVPPLPPAELVREVTTAMLAGVCTEAGAYEVLAKDACWSSGTWKVIDEADLPDLAFRDALALRGGVAQIDMAAAREVWRRRMRVARTPRMAALDVEQLRGRNVEAKKQELRDVTEDPAIDSAQTPEELKAVWPACLRA